jgi:hypothetical protein
MSSIMVSRAANMRAVATPGLVEPSPWSARKADHELEAAVGVGRNPIRLLALRCLWPKQWSIDPSTFFQSRGVGREAA